MSKFEEELKNNLKYLTKICLRFVDDVFDLDKQGSPCKFVASIKYANEIIQNNSVITSGYFIF